jgi:KipI family sensor histidine kinase inhibitor
MPDEDTRIEDWPRIDPVGVDGMLVGFGNRLSEAANRAALAFRAAAEATDLPGLQETSNTLASSYLRFDPDIADHDAMKSAVCALLQDRDWFQEPLPEGRRLWRIPTLFGTSLAPQLEEAAKAAGLSPEAAIRSISESRVRVQTIGFAPGQPYLGELPIDWDIPRQTQLTEKVPVGALTVAIRQLVLFSVSTPTGWRHIGQTAFRAFRPESETPFVLKAGDEVEFVPVGSDDYEGLRTQGPDGGATSEPLQ